MAGPLFTVGHSDRSLEEFLGILRDAGVTAVVDVRRLPGSAKHPQYNADALAESLRQAGIEYRRITGLGGRRPVSRSIPPEVNGFWENRSFHNYADHALGDEFDAGLAELRTLSTRKTVAIMCAEAVWWRCHRRIIADHLLAREETVIHLLGPGRSGPAQLTTGAVVGADGSVTYPAPAHRAPSDNP